MRSWIKLLSLLSVLVLPVACNEVAQETKTENSKIEAVPVPVPVVEEKVQINLAKLEAKILKHAKILHPQWDQLPEEFQAKQVQYLRMAWVKVMQINPEDMEYDLDHVNRFLQFVRLAGGNKFEGVLEKAAKLNFKAHAALAGAVHQQNENLLDPFLDSVMEQLQVDMHLNGHIVDVAQIYGIKLEGSAGNLPAHARFAEEVATRIEAAFNGQMPPNGTPIEVRLMQMFQVSTLKATDNGKHFNYYRFVLVPDTYSAPEEGIERFQMENTLYGAFQLKANPYIVSEAN